MKKIINKAHVEGKLYEVNLEEKVSQKTQMTFIRGKVAVQTDEEGLNVVTVDYNYVPTHFKSGKENKTYKVLRQLMSSGKSVTKNPDEVATLVKLSPSISLNEFYIDEDGSDKLVSHMTPEGGFADIVNTLSTDPNDRATFELDMVITSVFMVDGDPDTDTKDKLVLKGATFNFRDEMLPIEVAVTSDQGMKYFEGLEISANNPVFTKVWGKIVNETLITQITEESAFGEPTVKEVKKTKRGYIVTGTSKVPYEFDDESTMTAAELQEHVANREVSLVEKLQSQKEYQANKNAGITTGAATPPPAEGGFYF